MMEGQKENGGRALMVEAIAGNLAGVSSTFACHPLDIAKTRMQIYQATTSSSSKSLTTWGVISGLAQSDRPVASLCRGFTSNLLANSVSWAGFFYFKQYAEQAIVSMTGKTESTGFNAMHSLTSTMFAGITVQVLTNPLFVVKTRMLATDRSAPGAYPNTLACFRGIIAKEGLKAYYAGMGTSSFGLIQTGIQFLLYDGAKAWYAERQQEKIGSIHENLGEKKDETIGPVPTLIMSTTTKSFSTALLYPYQVIRARLQVHDSAARFGKGFIQVKKGLYKEAGLKGFYKGLVPGTVRNLPQTVVTFLVYESSKPVLRQMFRSMDDETQL